MRRLHAHRDRLRVGFARADGARELADVYEHDPRLRAGPQFRRGGAEGAKCHAAHDDRFYLPAAQYVDGHGQHVDLQHVVGEYVECDHRPVGEQDHVFGQRHGVYVDGWRAGEFLNIFLFQYV